MWNMLGGEIEWDALPLIAEIVGAEDIEGLILGLLKIRAYKSGG